MNKKQKETIAKIIKGKEKEILDEFLDHFLDRGLGSVTKSETDIYLFHLLQKYEKEKTVGLSNYEWSTLLKISERKIKTLRLEVGIRYDSDDEQDEWKSWVSFLNLITDGYLEFSGTSKVILTIENPYLLRFLEGNLKKMRLPSTDYSFNSERVTFSISSLEELLQKAADEISIGKGSTKAEDIFKKAKWTNYKKEARGQLFDIIKRAIPTVVKGIVFPTP